MLSVGVRPTFVDRDGKIVDLLVQRKFPLLIGLFETKTTEFEGHDRLFLQLNQCCQRTRRRAIDRLGSSNERHVALLDRCISGFGVHDETPGNRLDSLRMKRNEEQEQKEHRRVEQIATARQNEKERLKGLSDPHTLFS